MVQPAMAEKEIEEVMAEDKLREALAAYAHEAWSGWMKYMSSKVKEHGQYRGQGREMSGWLPVELRDRWARQMSTPYDELPESEKESDRAEADKIIAILDDHIDEEAFEVAKERLEDGEEDEYSAALKELERIGWPCRLRELPGLYEELARKQLEDKRESEGGNDG